MRNRWAVVTGVTLATLLLAGCGTGPTPEPTPTEPTPTDAGPQPAELVLPEDAVLGLVGILTAPNGATADLAVVVRASLPHMVPDATDAVAATVAWCTGEIDAAAIAGRGFTFTQVDIRLTARDGDWPADLALLALPVANPEVGSTIVAVAPLAQVDEATDEVFGDVVPPCRQPALLTGLGEGTVYLGIPQDIAGVNDAAAFTAWALHDFGLTAVLPGDLGVSAVEFSACAAEVTPLGTEFGAPSATWAERFEATGCAVGGATPTVPAG